LVSEEAMSAMRLVLLFCFLLLLGGCMVSEQIGEPTGTKAVVEQANLVREQ
jgi:hypothetical protein